MKLYISPGACSLSPHIVLRESGLAFELEQVDLRSHKTETGADFYAVNPKGYVPALALDDGQVLTEGPAIVQYVADQKGSAVLLPPVGQLGRYRVQEWLHFIGTELHKVYSPLFNPQTPDDAKKAALEKIATRLDFVSERLGTQSYLMGEQFMVCDAYLFVMLRWGTKMGPDASRWPNLKAYYERVRARPAVNAALETERRKN